MSWWGKLIGGAAGFAIAGPIGALIGTALGHAIDRQPGRAEPGESGDPTAATQTLFFTATFAVMGHIAKSDGQVSATEIRTAEQVMARLSLDGARRHFAQSLFGLGKRTDFPLADVLEQLRRASRSRDLRRVFLEIQVFAAYADGHVHPAERRILDQICEQLGFDSATLAQVERLVQAELGAAGGPTGRTGTHALADDYALLGVSDSADLATVKRAYRRLMSQHHPDRLISRGLPEEMIKLATSKTQSIKAAYERIRDARS